MEQYIGIPPRGLPLALHWMCFLFPRYASAAVFKLAQHLLAHLLGCFKNEKDLSIWQPKAEKNEEKRKHDSGKLSDGDKRAFFFGSQRRWSLSLLVLTLIFPALLPCLVRDSLCTALQTKILWINRSLNAIDTIETWASGNLTALTEGSQPAIRWRVGEVANRVSCGSFRGGH